MADPAPDDAARPVAPEPAPRRRGLVGTGYILGPVVVLWFVGFGVSWYVGQRHRPELVPYTVALYGCGAFFIHGYWLAWRAGTVLRRYSALLLSLVILVALAGLHADDAEARVVYDLAGPHDRPAEPALFVAAAADLVAATLLLLHGVVLGLGSRAARVIETALGIDDDDDDNDDEVDDDNVEGATDADDPGDGDDANDGDHANDGEDSSDGDDANDGEDPNDAGGDGENAGDDDDPDALESDTGAAADPDDAEGSARRPQGG